MDRYKFTITKKSNGSWFHDTVDSDWRMDAEKIMEARYDSRVYAVSITSVERIDSLKY